MASEIQVAFQQTGKTLYALIRNSTGSVWQTTTNTFVTYTTANLANYDVALTEQGTASRYYAGTFPTNISTAGVYSVAVYRQVGGSPAEGDPLVAVGDIHWNGAAVVNRGTLNTGAITSTVIANDAITSSGLADTAVSEIQSGLATASALSTVGGAVSAIKTVTDNLPNAGALTVIKNVTDKLDTAMELDGSVYRFTTNALEQAPTGGGGGDATAANQTTIINHLTDIKGATFSGATDSLEAIRDRGDSAWITATGFSTLDAAGVRSAVGLASADLDTQLATIAGYIDTEITTTLAGLTAIEADTQDIQARLPAALVSGRMDVTIGAMQTGTLTAAALAADAAQEIADALLDRTAGVETSYTVRQALRLILAALAGKLQGAGTTTVQIRDVNDSKDRITATVDANGNRSAVTLDAS